MSAVPTRFKLAISLAELRRPNLTLERRCLANKRHARHLHMLTYGKTKRIL
jgi:hypothetical protein